MAQTVENLPAMQEIWVPYLVWEDSPGEGSGYRPNILAWRIPWTEDLGGYSPRGGKEVAMTEQLSLSLACMDFFFFFCLCAPYKNMVIRSVSHILYTYLHTQSSQ